MAGVFVVAGVRIAVSGDRVAGVRIARGRWGVRDMCIGRPRCGGRGMRFGLGLTRSFRWVVMLAVIAHVAFY